MKPRRWASDLMNVALFPRSTGFIVINSWCSFNASRRRGDTQVTNFRQLLHACIIEMQRDAGFDPAKQLELLLYDAGLIPPKNMQHFTKAGVIAFDCCNAPYP